MNVKIVRANRGFWKDLFETKIPNVNFVQENIVLTEDIRKNSKKILWKMSQLKILDLLGIYQQIKIRDNNYDVYFSYNRFLKANRSYVLAVENPTAMVHYHPKLSRGLIGHMNLKKTFKNKNLKTIVCLSQACLSTMDYYYDIPKDIKLMQIYPYVKDCISKEEFSKKLESNNINCLFISSNFYLKGGSELLQAIKDNCWDNNSNLHFDIITKISDLEPETLKIINTLKNVSLYDFKFSKEELNQFYKKANIFINLTRNDSFSLVTLEALHFGCAFITTAMYAIKEMVIDDYNGYLTSPTIKVWNDDNTRNEKLSPKDIKKLYSNYIDNQKVIYLTQKLNYLIENQKKLKIMEQHSYELSKSKFSSESIKNKWKNVFEEMMKNE